MDEDFDTGWFLKEFRVYGDFFAKVGEMIDGAMGDINFSTLGVHVLEAGVGKDQVDR